MYSPQLGRFLQRDPAGYVDGMNLYSYVNNSPLNYIDPLGLCKSNKNTFWNNFRESIYEDFTGEDPNSFVGRAIKGTPYWEDFWDVAIEDKIWEQWHIDVGYTGMAPGGLKAGISLGLKADLHGLYFYHSPGLGKGAGVSATFVSGRANKEEYGVHTWVKGGTGVFGVSGRGGVKKGEDGAQFTGAIGAGFGIGKGVSVGPRQIIPIWEWNRRE